MVELESHYWLVIRSKFRMGLWCKSKGRPKIRGTLMLAEVKGSWASRCVPNESVICKRSWNTEYVLRDIPPACVAVLAGKRGRKRRWSAMSFRIRLRSIAVSTRACTSCHTRTTTSHCRQAGFLSFAWRWTEPDSFTKATCIPAVLSLAPSHCLTLRDFFRHCASLWPFLSQ